ncbi:MAG TPA: pullulanase-associated domain-containing protein, partial [Pseudodesulfovibrio sp.]|nr:pullulanase-associated domain-containing protein [Pseudodesulfovibrio sp.]
MKPIYHLSHLMILFALLASTLAPITVAAQPLAQSASCPEVTLHYHRVNGDYDDWGLHIWGPTDVSGVTWTSPYLPTGEDDFGLIWVVPMQSDADFLDYIVHLGDEKDPGPDQRATFGVTGCEFWLIQGDETQYSNPEDALAGAPPPIELIEAPKPGENQVVIHYSRSRGDYTGWGLHIWGPTDLADAVTWTSPLQPTGQDEYGLYWVIDLQPEADYVNYIVHRGDEKDPGPDQDLDIPTTGREIWLIQGSGEKFTNHAAALEALKLTEIGDITRLRAYWVSQRYIVWPIDVEAGYTYALITSPDASIRITPDGLQGAEAIPLTPVDNGLSPELAFKFPHLANMQVFEIPQDRLAHIPELLQGQVGVMAETPWGELIDITGLQIPGVLDDL